MRLQPRLQVIPPQVVQVLLAGVRVVVVVVATKEPQSLAVAGSREAAPLANCWRLLIWVWRAPSWSSWRWE